jgi:ribosomal protein L29
MKSLRTNELRTQAEPDLKRMIAENEARIVALNFQKITGHLEKPAQISTLYRQGRQRQDAEDRYRYAGAPGCASALQKVF